MTTEVPNVEPDQIHSSGMQSASPQPVAGRLSAVLQHDHIAHSPSISDEARSELSGSFDYHHNSIYSSPFSHGQLCSPQASTTRHHDPLMESLTKSLSKAGVTQEAVAYLSKCIDLHFIYTYPIVPILHRSTINETMDKVNNSGARWDTRMFTLVTAACSYTLALVPGHLTSASLVVAEAFYKASKSTLDSYMEQDIEYPDHSSIAIRVFHSGWAHAAGKSKASWHILGESVRLVQSMRLHDEASYERMDPLEGQLCRRIFWALYTSDKSAAILGGHPQCLASSLFKEGITAAYPDDFPGQDLICVSTTLGSEQQMSIMTGFNANQDLWRAAEPLLLLTADDISHIQQGGSHPVLSDASPELATLTEQYMRFITCLDDLPAMLRFHPNLGSSPHEFVFADKSVRPEPPRAIAIQRTNLQASYQCLKMVILRNLSAVWAHRTIDSRDFLLDHFLGRASVNADQLADSPLYILETLRVAEDMLYVAHTSGLDLIRINGEACTEKIRLVGASILELIARNPASPLMSAARRYSELYPHVLALLNSKLSERAQYNATETNQGRR
ncbi:hypothetical protein NM208_g5798 [Fusarium decemcellulare]|uniref:Uncharacterized protein n=1 Tax=Fusarium decemcellulare TaxID=57161 RepID=A0ACC1SFN0_9HYPO|nr:hypothetical protein NM208_g5798 [Fusarium decemcellulare]